MEKFIAICKVNETKVEFLNMIKKDIISIIGCRLIREALEEKIEHMIFVRHGSLDVVAMLYSFDSGVKKLNTHQSEYEHRCQFEYTMIDGNEKLRKGKNLERAHFRWNHGTRYKLEKNETEEIRKRIEPLYNSLFTKA